MSSSEIENMDIDNLPSSCYSYDRFQLHIKANRLFESFKEVGYYFPRRIFLKYTLGELRVLAAKIYRSWQSSTAEERKQIFLPDGNVYPPEFTSRIFICSSSILLKNTILDSLLQSITFPENYENKLYGCLKTLLVLGNINEESHSIIQDNGLCDCGQNGSYHYTDTEASMNMLGSIIDEMIN